MFVVDTRLFDMFCVCRPCADREKCVKEYQRTTVGVKDANPSSVRPPDVLVHTTDYLIHK